jgi:hypothetical protein
MAFVQAGLVFDAVSTKALSADQLPRSIVRNQESFPIASGAPSLLRTSPRELSLQTGKIHGACAIPILKMACSSSPALQFRRLVSSARLASPRQDREAARLFRFRRRLTAHRGIAATPTDTCQRYPRNSPLRDVP